MKRLLLTVAFLTLPIAAFSNLDLPNDLNVLIGTWIGKATGPDGGPPTGDITVTFEGVDDEELKGRIIVEAGEGFKYSGKIDRVELDKKILSARATFTFGENPLVAEIRGPLKGKSIEGRFTVSSQGQTLGEGVFNITKTSTTSPKR